MYTVHIDRKGEGGRGAALHLTPPGNFHPIQSNPTYSLRSDIPHKKGHLRRPKNFGKLRVICHHLSFDSAVYHLP